MRILQLGTAAAEGIPALFCQCETCRKSREAGGRNLRSRSQALIDEELLIDLPADTLMHAFYGGLDLTKVRHCIITHSHQDHFYPEELCNRKVGFAHLQEEFPLMVYGSENTLESLEALCQKVGMTEQRRVICHPVKPFEAFQAGEYTIHPLVADHEKRISPLFYWIEKGEKAILYAHDTFYFPEEDWEYLAQKKPYFSYVSLDCTELTTGWPGAHMSFAENIRVKERLLEMGCADEKTKFVVNHFSHNGGYTYDQMCPVVEKEGFEATYDGFTFEI